MDDVDTKWLDAGELATWARLVALLELLPAGLDSQLRRDADLTNFEYYVLAMLSDNPEDKLRMTALAAQTNSTLPRLSHVVRRLESRELVERFPSERDRRATNVRLTDRGRAKLVATAPMHVEYVREHVIDPLTADQVDQLRDIAESILERLDPEGTMTPMYHRYDEAAAQAAAARSDRPDAGQAGDAQPATGKPEAADYAPGDAS